MGVYKSATTRSRSATCRTSCLGVLAILGLLVATAACQAPRERLVLRETQARELTVGETVSYDLSLEAEQFVEIVVDQRGVDVAVVLADAAGRPVVATDTLVGAFGPEHVLWIAPEKGAYRLELRAHEQLAESGRCAVSVVALRPATVADRARVAAATSSYGADRSLAEGETERAVTLFTEALERWSELEEPYWQALAHYSLGYIFFTSRGENFRPDAALEHYLATVALAETSSELASSAHFALGRIYLDHVFDLEEARHHYEESLRLSRQLEDLLIQAKALNDLGYLYKNLGELHRALSSYDDALAIWRELGNSPNEANTLHNRGKLLRILGRSAPALGDFQDALSTWENAGDPSRVAFTLIGLAEVLTDTERLDEAQSTLERALALAGDEPDNRARVLAEMAEIHARRSDHGSAKEALEESLRLFRELGERRSEAAVLIRLGLLQNALQPVDALELFAQAAALNARLGLREIEAAVHIGVAGAHRRLGDLDEARQSAEQAITLIEELRSLPKGTDSRSSFFATKQDYYDFYIDLLMEMSRREHSQHHEATALAASERSRARSLLDTLAGSGIDFRWENADPWLARERQIEHRIESLYFRRTQLLETGRDPDAVARLQGDLRELLRDLDEIRGEIRHRDPARAAFTQSEPLQVAEIQSQVLDGDTLLLEYHLGAARSFVWAVTADSIATVELPGRSELERSAEWAYRLMSVPREHRTRYAGRLEEALQKLGDQLIRPVADRLVKSRLLIAAEGALQYVPFAALPSRPQRPLVADHEIVSIPSASTLALLRRRPELRDATAKSVAILADPIFGPNDPRAPSFGSAAGGATAGTRDVGNQQLFARLPFSRLEAEYIQARAGTEGNLLALGYDATGQIVADGSLSRYPYIHFATHSVVDNEIPELSSLILSQIDSRGNRREDGFFRMHQVYQMHLQAELVTLSACRTAAGKSLAGEGLVGWTQGFMYSGAKRVLVSLWSVDDQATAELMGALYADLLNEDLPAATALRKAQNAIRSRPEWRSPYYWAAFVLQGEYL